MKKRVAVLLISLALILAFAPGATAKEDCWPGVMTPHPWYGETCVSFEYTDCYACEIIVVPS
jgi:hypothetical protein